MKFRFLTFDASVMLKGGSCCLHLFLWCFGVLELYVCANVNHDAVV